MSPIPNWLAVPVPCGILIYHRLSYTLLEVRIKAIAAANQQAFLASAGGIIKNKIPFLQTQLCGLIVQGPLSPDLGGSSCGGWATGPLALCGGSTNVPQSPDDDHVRLINEMVLCAATAEHMVIILQL